MPRRRSGAQPKPVGHSRPRLGCSSGRCPEGITQTVLVETLQSSRRPPSPNGAKGAVRPAFSSKLISDRRHLTHPRLHEELRAAAPTTPQTFQQRVEV